MLLADVIGQWCSLTIGFKIKNKRKRDMKKFVLNFLMVVFCLAAVCFVLPVIIMLPFLMASAISAVCAGLLHKLSKVS